MTTEKQDLRNKLDVCKLACVVFKKFVFRLILKSSIKYHKSIKKIYFNCTNVRDKPKTNINVSTFI